MDMRYYNLEAVGPSFDVCAIGNAIVDVIANGDDAFLEAHDIKKNVMNLVDSERADFLYQRIGPGVETSGGSAANTAAGIASLGGTPAYIGRVRNDAWGNVFRHDLHALGVYYATPPAEDGPSTARCLIVVTPDAQRSMNTYLGASTDLSAADIDPKPIQASQITYLEGYLFDKPSAQEAFFEAAKIAHAADRQLALNLSDPFCVERHREDFLELVRTQVDLLIGNEAEFTSLFQVQTLAAAVDAAREMCRMVVATKGAQGALLAKDEKTTLIPAEEVSSVIDTTGAGDMFSAGLLFGMTHGFDLTQSTRLGAIAAGEVISHFGPRPLCPLKDYVAEKGIKV